MTCGMAFGFGGPKTHRPIRSNTVGSGSQHPPRADMVLPPTPPFPPLVLRCSSGVAAAPGKKAVTSSQT